MSSQVKAIELSDDFVRTMPLVGRFDLKTPSSFPKKSENMRDGPKQITFNLKPTTALMDGQTLKYLGPERNEKTNQSR